mgnify:CR=1 FL=1
MSRRSSLVSLNQISDINMTPLMDLTFILLITFIITFPLIEQGVSINLPKGNASTISETSSRTISINAEGSYYLDDDLLSQSELREFLLQLSLTQPDQVIFLRADQTLPYGKVMDLIRMLHDAKISRMALITEADTF